MAREIEIKLRLADPDALRARLRHLGATHLGSVFEVNVLFDTPDSRLRNTGCGLRIRTSQPLDGDARRIALLTFKGPRASAGAIRDREELEVEFADPDVLRPILERLGFAPRIEYEKRRETWTLAQAEIALDEIPHFGWFVEIEAQSANAVRELQCRLGFSDADVCPQTYVELTALHGEVTGGIRRLGFSNPS